MANYNPPVHNLTIFDDFQFNQANEPEYLDQLVVHKAGTETITGAKTFSSIITGTSNINVSGASSNNTISGLNNTINCGLFPNKTKLQANTIDKITIDQTNTTITNTNMNITTTGSSGNDLNIGATGGGGVTISNTTGDNIITTTSGSNKLSIGSTPKITTTSILTTIQNKQNKRISDGTSTNAYAPAIIDGYIYDSAQRGYTLYIGDATSNILAAIYTLGITSFENSNLSFYSTQVGGTGVTVATLGAGADIYLNATGNVRMNAATSNILQVGGSTRITTTTSSIILQDAICFLAYILPRLNVEIGYDTPSSQTYIDFHSNNTYTNDYDSRIISEGSGSAGNGTSSLLIAATSLRLSYLTGSSTRAISVNSVGGIVLTPSDKRLKENITPIDAETTHLKILQLEPKNYDWIDKKNMGSETEIGLIAQEVIEIIPELVFKQNDGMYAIHYDRIPTLLLQSVKELQKQIDELKAEMLILKSTSNV